MPRLLAWVTRRSGGALRPAWWRELVLVATTYGLYTLTRNSLPAHEARARANALDLFHAEKHLHLDLELGLNDLVAGSSANPLAFLANYTYALSHFGVTFAVLGWIYVARPHAYRSARTVLLLTTLLGLVGYWLYPLAPPRFFPQLGFVDTIVRDHMWGSWGSTTVTEISNQYAAMPSMHVAWSIWSAAAVAVLARSRWLKVAAVLYPVAVFFVIVGTANHWTLDAVGGLAVLGIGAAIYAVASRGRRRYGHSGTHGFVHRLETRPSRTNGSLATSCSASSNESMSKRMSPPDRSPKGPPR